MIGWDLMIIINQSKSRWSKNRLICTIARRTFLLFLDRACRPNSLS